MRRPVRCLKVSGTWGGKKGRLASGFRARWWGSMDENSVKPLLRGDLLVDIFDVSGPTTFLRVSAKVPFFSASDIQHHGIFGVTPDRMYSLGTARRWVGKTASTGIELAIGTVFRRNVGVTSSPPLPSLSHLVCFGERVATRLRLLPVPCFFGADQRAPC